MYILIVIKYLINFCVFDAKVVNVENILNLAKHTHVFDALIHSFSYSLLLHMYVTLNVMKKLSHDPWMLNICCFCGTP